MPRVKRDYRSVGKDVYERFCKAHPEIKISFKKWKEIVYAFNYELREYILNSGEKVKLMWGIGPIVINKKRRKKIIVHEGKEYVNLAVNWKRTKEIGKRIYHTNPHTDGNSFKWLWFPREARFYFSVIWNFKPVRETSRRLKEVLVKPDSPHAQLYKTWTRK